MIKLEQKENLLVIVGPTAIGKTAVSIDVAKKLNGEIISADSMQIYKYMDIGTAKVKPEEMEGISHYLIDVVYPDEEFTVADFKYHAEKYIKKINAADKVPIVVGGSGLYLNSIVYELGFTKIKKNEEFRKKCEELAHKYGVEYLYNKLKQIDPITSSKISPNDTKRIIRALEVYNETGKPMSYFNKNFREKTDKYNLLMIGLNTDRATLYARIEERVDKMIEEGLIEEVQNLLDMGYTRDLVSMQAIGYKEIISYLYGETSLKEAINILKRNTRRFAKRQLTWFKRDDRIKWIDIKEFNSINEIGDYIVNNYKNMLSN